MSPESGVFARDFAISWENAKDYTLALAEAMPEEEYGLRPTPEVRSFDEALLHIAAINFNFVARLIQEEQPPVQLEFSEPVAGRTKTDIIALLTQSYDYGLEAINTLSDEQAQQKASMGREMSRASILFSIKDHVTHHRAQLVVYLRLQGLTPPPYVGW